MADGEHLVMDLLCGKLQTSWSYCDQSCISCKFYHEESDMAARVSICVHGFGSSKESCDCYMTQHQYSEFVRSGFANLKTENAKLLESCKKWLGKAAHLEAENEKLREFLAEVFYNYWDFETDGCFIDPDIDEYERRMDELGIKWR